MNIRKHWKKFALSLTAFFWASCHYEDTAQPLYGENCPSGSCIEPKIEGAESLYGVHSPSEGFDDPDLFSIIPASSNTKAAASSSSEVKVPYFSSSAKVPSSSSLNLNAYRLASDPSITCIQDFINGGKCLDEEDAKSNKEAIQRKIDEYKKTVEENQTLTLEQLDSLEEEINANLKEWLDADYKAYRTPKSHCTHVDLGTLVYKCSNNESYEASTLATDNENHILYTKEEHRAQFPEKYQSSSSSEPESSNSTTPPSPLCQKSDFATSDDILEATENIKKELLDSAKKELGTNLAEKDSICLDRVENTYISPSTDVIAKKQTCDGETIVNPRYQQELDTLKASVKKLIDKCIEYSKIEQIACDISEMCPEYGVDSKCTYKYSCNDGLSCRRTEGERDLNCSNKQGEEIKYTQEEFEKKYYTKSRY
jgi:hypothetical protein